MATSGGHSPEGSSDSAEQLQQQQLQKSPGRKGKRYTNGWGRGWRGGGPGGGRDQPDGGGRKGAWSDGDDRRGYGGEGGTGPARFGRRRIHPQGGGDSYNLSGGGPEVYGARRGIGGGGGGAGGGDLQLQDGRAPPPAVIYSERFQRQQQLPRLGQLYAPAGGPPRGQRHYGDVVFQDIETAEYHDEMARQRDDYLPLLGAGGHRERRVRIVPPPDHHSRSQIGLRDDEIGHHVMDVLDDGDIDSMRRHEIERGSEIGAAHLYAQRMAALEEDDRPLRPHSGPPDQRRQKPQHPGYERRESNSADDAPIHRIDVLNLEEENAGREHHYFKEGGAEVLRLVTHRGQSSSGQPALTTATVDDTSAGIVGDQMGPSASVHSRYNTLPRRADTTQLRYELHKQHSLPDEPRDHGSLATRMHEPRAHGGMPRMQEPQDHDGMQDSRDFVGMSRMQDHGEMSRMQVSRDHGGMQRMQDSNDHGGGGMSRLQDTRDYDGMSRMPDVSGADMSNMQAGTSHPSYPSRHPMRDEGKKIIMQRFMEDQDDRDSPRQRDYYSTDNDGQQILDPMATDNQARQGFMNQAAMDYLHRSGATTTGSSDPDGDEDMDSRRAHGKVSRLRERLEQMQSEDEYLHHPDQQQWRPPPPRIEEPDMFEEMELLPPYRRRFPGKHTIQTPIMEEGESAAENEHMTDHSNGHDDSLGRARRKRWDKPSSAEDQTLSQLEPQTDSGPSQEESRQQKPESELNGDQKSTRKTGYRMEIEMQERSKDVEKKTSRRRQSYMDAMKENVEPIVRGAKKVDRSPKKDKSPRRHSVAQLERTLEKDVALKLPKNGRSGRRGSYELDETLQITDPALGAHALSRAISEEGTSREADLDYLFEPSPDPSDEEEEEPHEMQRKVSTTKLPSTEDLQVKSTKGGVSYKMSRSSSESSTTRAGRAQQRPPLKKKRSTDSTRSSSREDSLEKEERREKLRMEMEARRMSLGKGNIGAMFSVSVPTATNGISSVIAPDRKNGGTPLSDKNRKSDDNGKSMRGSKASLNESDNGKKVRGFVSSLTSRQSKGEAAKAAAAAATAVAVAAAAAEQQRSHGRDDIPSQKTNEISNGGGGGESADSSSAGGGDSSSGGGPGRGGREGVAGVAGDMMIDDAESRKMRPTGSNDKTNGGGGGGKHGDVGKDKPRKYSKGVNTDESGSPSGDFFDLGPDAAAEIATIEAEYRARLQSDAIARADATMRQSTMSLDTAQRHASIEARAATLEPHRAAHSAPEDDLDSGIALSQSNAAYQQSAAKRKKNQYLEKKSIFTIAYDDMQTKQLRTGSASPQ